MADDERLIEIMADLLAEMREMDANSRAFQQATVAQFAAVDKRLERLEDHQIKTNAALGELRLSVMNLATASSNYSNWSGA